MKGGGGLVYQLKRSYSLTDMRERSGRDESPDRFTDITDQEGETEIYTL